MLNVTHVLQAIEGLFDEADMHVHGLSRLVQLRGGPQVFKDAFYIARVIDW